MNKKIMIMALILAGIAAGNTAMACGLSKATDAEETVAPEGTEVTEPAPVVEE